MTKPQKLRPWYFWPLLTIGGIVVVVYLIINFQSPPTPPPPDGVEALIKTARAMHRHPVGSQPWTLTRAPLRRIPHAADHILRWLVAARPDAKKNLSTPEWWLAANAFINSQDRRNSPQVNVARWLNDATLAARPPLYASDPQEHRRRLTHHFGHDGPASWSYPRVAHALVGPTTEG